MIDKSPNHVGKVIDIKKGRGLSKVAARVPFIGGVYRCGSVLEAALESVQVLEPHAHMAVAQFTRALLPVGFDI